MADNDDFDDISLEEMAATEPVVTGRTDFRRAATHSIPDMMIRRALTPEQEQKLRRDKTTCMVIMAPSIDWVEPLLRAGKLLGDWKFAHAAPEAPRKTYRGDVAAEQAIFAMSGGGRILGVTHNLDFLPKAMVASADILLKIPSPDDTILREAIKLATGRSVRSLPAGISAGLSYGDVCGAIRTGSSAKACVARLVEAASSKAKVDAGNRDVPTLDKLHGYGAAMEWSQALVTDLEAWRAGELNFSAIERTAIWASAPGLGKTSLARSLAKTAGIPLIATSVSSWFSDSSGYLDGVIKRIDQVFAEAAAVAPALLLLDECEGLPQRFGSDRNSAWWTPVVGHMLLKLDSAVSDVSSKLIIVGATNHPEKLDPALVRPGRMSKIIRIDMPDAGALQGIFRQHLGDDLPDADLTGLAKAAAGSSGAQVHDWIKSARRVVRQEHRLLRLEDLFDQVLPNESRPPDLVRRVAVHEAAHAVVSHVLKPGSVELVTIVGRDESEGGRTATTWSVNQVMSRPEIENAATVCLAGRCGEQVLLNSITSGAGGDTSSDLGRATFLLSLIHATFGLGENLLHRATSQTVMNLLTLDPVLSRTVEADLQRLYAKALKIVEDNVVLVEAVADALIQHRHLTGEQFITVCDSAIRKSFLKLTGGRNG